MRFMASSMASSSCRFGPKRVRLVSAMRLATVSLMAETNLTLLGPKRQELEAIEEAMNRIEGGSYGYCEVCGLSIEPRRLEIMPEAPLCRNCMSHREKLAKATAR